MKEHTEIKQESTESHSSRYGGSGFKKKKGFKKHNNSTYIDDVFRGQFQNVKGRSGIIHKNN